jgi:hypothetical protein
VECTKKEAKEHVGKLIKCTGSSDPLGGRKKEREKERKKGGRRQGGKTHSYFMLESDSVLNPL